MKTFYILDERDVWHEAACKAARKHGYAAKRIFSGDIDVGNMLDGDVGFIRPHADWRKLPKNRNDDLLMRSKLLMIQDRAQVEVYEDKSEQFRRWSHWMPDTWRFTNEAEAQALLDTVSFPLVSKADVGASSVNVRILKDKAEAQKHITQLFGKGIKVHHGANCPETMQHGYALLQRFIPHVDTYRVNAIGDARAVFFRHCYPDRPVAQTGNTDAAYVMTDEIESLLEYSDRLLADIGSKWCALDILKDADGSWKLLETSLAWPWSVDAYSDAAIFRGNKGRKWAQIFDVLFDELERGAWSSGH